MFCVSGGEKEFTCLRVSICEREQLVDTVCDIYCLFKKNQHLLFDNVQQKPSPLQYSTSTLTVANHYTPIEVCTATSEITTTFTLRRTIFGETEFD